MKIPSPHFLNYLIGFYHFLEPFIRPLKENHDVISLIMKSGKSERDCSKPFPVTICSFNSFVTKEKWRLYAGHIFPQFIMAHIFFEYKNG